MRPRELAGVAGPTEPATSTGWSAAAAASRATRTEAALISATRPSRPNRARRVLAGAESVGLDDVSAGGDVGAVDRLDELGPRNAELREREIERYAGGLKHRAHGAVADEDAGAEDVGGVS